MAVLEFTLPIFTGPLDLLLDLISKHKLNIADIEISVILEQYLSYLGQARDADIELSGAFLETAAHLIYIKTASLLPKPEADLAEKMKRELEGALIEYSLCKEAARFLSALYVGGTLFTRKPADVPGIRAYNGQHGTAELISALSAVAAAGGMKILRNREVDFNKEYLMPDASYEYTSVFTKIIFILKHLRRNENYPLTKLFRGQTRTEKTATFLAILELSKYERVCISDDCNYLEIRTEKDSV
ncbi:segregation and condensation protein A [Clostridia bacterium]|nr:segregation and condensation protein A [Clostridia bacterium]